MACQIKVVHVQMKWFLASGLSSKYILSYPQPRLNQVIKFHHFLCRLSEDMCLFLSYHELFNILKTHQNGTNWPEKWRREERRRGNDWRKILIKIKLESLLCVCSTWLHVLPSSFFLMFLPSIPSFVPSSLPLNDFFSSRIVSSRVRWVFVAWSPNCGSAQMCSCLIYVSLKCVTFISHAHELRCVIAGG